jgi:hypothetical protein
MSVQVKRRRDTAANIAAASFAPASGELVVDTTNNRVLVGDGSTIGGWPAAKLSEVLLSGSSLLTLAQGALGSLFKVGVLEQSVTLSGASTTAATNIPNGCILLGVGCYVKTAVTGATSFSVGDSGVGDAYASTTRFGSCGIAAGSASSGIISPIGIYSATPIVITSVGGSFTGGVLHLAAFYVQITPPTS